MKVSFFRRIQTTLRADAHGMVDALEDQALLLRQHLRDAEAEVQRKRARVTQLDGEQRRLDIDRERIESEVRRSERDSELALSQGRDDLARYALKQMLQRRRTIASLDARMARIRDERKELDGALEVQSAALIELREKVDAYLSACEGAHADIESTPITDEQVELELIRRKTASPSPAAATDSSGEVKS